MTTTTITVDVTPPYPVSIGPDLKEAVAETVTATRLALISDAGVAPLHAGALEAALSAAGKEVTRYVVDPGEGSKSLAAFESLLRKLVRDGFDRKAAVLALGGGVVGDLAGFVAASFMRGVDFYNLPTSLLAMVDASVGGKTGVNLPEGKNLVGAFWQPRAVFIDVGYLKTLPEREFKQGAVELFKHGLLEDKDILAAMDHPDFGPHGEPGFLTEVIGRSVAVKARIVAGDEREHGKRAFLNLGHSLAHALEARSDHTIAHGDAVAYGLVFAAKLAALRGMADETARTLAFLRWLEPFPLAGIAFSELEPYLARDKKVAAGKLRWVLLERLGEPLLVDDISPGELKAAWAFLREETDDLDSQRT